MAPSDSTATVPCMASTRLRTTARPRPESYAELEKLSHDVDVALADETDDIAELEQAAEGLDEAPAAQQVYEHLAGASQMHLEVFSR